MTPTANGEVTIICLTDLVHLHDIGVHLTRGHRVNIPMSQAMKSRDLSAAKLDGTVTIQTIRSAATVRAHEFTSSDTTHSQAPRHSPPPPQVPTDPILAAIERLTVEVQGMRADITRLQQQRPVAPPVAPPVVVDILAELKEYVRTLPQVGRTESALESMRPTQQVQGFPPAVVAVEEMFIPSNLTGGATASDLKVASETSTSPQLTGTAEALKAARKKRGR